MNTQRPLSVTIAAVLLGLVSVLWNLSFPLWADAVPREEAVPAVIVYVTVVVGVAGLVAAAALWTLKRWGIWLAIAVCVLNTLDGASGAAGAPNAALQFVGGAIALVCALVILLVVLPSSRRAYASGA